MSRALQGYIPFSYAQQVFRIERQVYTTKGEPKRQESVYGVTSLCAEQAYANRLLELNRGHWEIENRLHWVRDVLFHEDQSQVRTKEGPRTMATLRNLASSLFRLRGHSNIARARRWLGRNVSRVLELVGV